jgi:CRP-like cAMP-binding protein
MLMYFFVASLLVIVSHASVEKSLHISNHRVAQGYPRTKWVKSVDRHQRPVYTQEFYTEGETGYAQVGEEDAPRRLAGGNVTGIRTPEPFDAVCHVALLIEAVAFAQSDITYLRLLEVTAAGMVVIYTLGHSNGNWLDCHVMWGLVHVAINLFRIMHSYYKLYKVNTDLTSEERYLREHHLLAFSPLEFAALRQHWTMEEIPQGEAIMTAKEPVEYLILIHSGFANVMKDGKVVAQVGEGQFLGEMAYFTEESASATIEADGMMTIVKWKMSEVKKHSHSHHHSEKASAFKKLPSLFCRDLASKMKAANEAKKTQQSFFSRKTRFSVLSGGKRLSMQRFSAVSRRLNQRGTKNTKRESLVAQSRASIQGEKGVGRVSLSSGSSGSGSSGSAPMANRVSLQGKKASGGPNKVAPLPATVSEEGAEGVASVERRASNAAAQDFLAGQPNSPQSNSRDIMRRGSKADSIDGDLHDLTKATQQRQATKAVLRGPSANMLAFRANQGHRRTLL